MLSERQSVGLPAILQKMNGLQVSAIYTSEKCFVKGKVYQLHDAARANHERRLKLFKENRLQASLKV